MEEVLKMLSENPEQATAIGYGALATGAAAYLAHKNDFGADGMTDRDIEMYLDDTEDTYHPLKMYKRRVLNKELSSRD